MNIARVYLRVSTDAQDLKRQEGIIAEAKVRADARADMLMRLSPA
jgi:DNA invertase Pin-like site-specific DNA recombinase